jgi:homoserine O-succinyltransferase
MTVLLRRSLGRSENLEPQSPWPHSGAPSLADSADCIDIALINNMPDGALHATERQYVTLLAEAAGDLAIRLTPYVLPELPRTARERGLLGSDVPVRELWATHHDAAIITGTEPRESDLTREAYWMTLTRVIEWTQGNAISAIFSCLAAHAAVLHLDGIARRPLARKCFGIFPCERARSHALTDGIAFPALVQHSRWNALDGEALEAAGYAVLTRSASAGIDVFVRDRQCLSVFFQGHPEYDFGTLMREYRRDITRFLRRETDVYPDLPEGCVNAATAARMARFRRSAMEDRSESLMAGFPPLADAAPMQINGTDETALRLYGNWLSMIAARKAQRHCLPRWPAARQASLSSIVA